MHINVDDIHVSGNGAEDSNDGDDKDDDDGSLFKDEAANEDEDDGASLGGSFDEDWGEEF